MTDPDDKALRDTARRLFHPDHQDDDADGDDQADDTDTDGRTAARLFAQKEA